MSLLVFHSVAAEPDSPPGSESLRTALHDLSRTFGARYPRANVYLLRLDSLQQRWSKGEPEARKTVTAELERLRAEALVANPLVSGQPILFVTRAQFINNHGTEATMCQTHELEHQYFRGGGAMKLLDLANGGKVTTLLALPQGLARDPEVSFDGKRILFSMRRDAADDYHLYEMNADGTDRRQLTFAPRVSDIQPVYLPDGQIAFSSTREPKYIPCQRHLMCNLFVMNADGANIRQLGHNTQFEGRASLMPDGRLLYTRWEYVDKHYASAYGLWTANPDGTAHALYFGGYGWQPGPMVDARAIPGTDQVVCVFTTVHELAWGALVLADRRRGLGGLEPIVKCWPADLTPYMKNWNTLGRIGGGFDSFMALPIKYEDPYPLSAKYFLCSRTLDARRREMGLFLVDVFGNEVLLHAEAPGCFDPMPLAPRERPPVIPSRVELAADTGTFYVADVYQGDGMEAVRRGTVKFLRVVEAPAKLTYPPPGIGDWTPALDPDGHHPVAVNWNHYNTKRVLGKVPVEPDGSAHFTVPAGKFVYFQLLDENDMMIHSMRSGAFVQPGETAGCVGCHEYRLSAPTPRERQPLALRRPPSPIQPWYGAARDFSYTVEVQPVLDRHCVRCHDYGQAAERHANLSGNRGSAFNISYAELLRRAPAIWSLPRPGERKPLISSVGCGPIRSIPPYSWGSHRSRLLDLLRQGHHGVRLDPESLERLATWIDLNIPYHPTHATYYQTNTFGQCPLDHEQLTRLGQLLAAAPGGAAHGWTTVNDYGGGELSRLIMTVGEPINFTRPERSLCLSAFANPSDADFTAALDLIRAGQTMLGQHPRADMPGFRPCPDEQARLDYYASRRQIEQQNRLAIRDGAKRYDH